MTGPDGENEFEDFLARRSSLHRRLADRDGIEPPPELDRIVLAKAREAIRRPSDLPLYRSPPWAVPVAIAATLVVAFAVVLHMGRAGLNGAPVTATMSASANAQPASAGTVAKAKEIAPAGAPVQSLAKKSAEAAPPSSDVAPEQYTEADRPLLASNGAVATTRERELRRDASTQQQHRTVVDTRAPAAPAPPTAVLADQDKHVDQQAWLREIERLRAEGRISEADRKLAEYRKVFPSSKSAPAAADTRPPTR